MGFKSFFIKEKDEEKPLPKQPAKVVSMSPSTYVTEGGTDYNEYLDNIMKTSNQPGLDFYEFSEAIKALRGMPLSEEQMYKVTYATYQGSGITSDKLVVSAQNYLTILNKEKADFDTQLKGTRIQEVDNKAKQILAETTAINDLNAQIAAKQNLINKLNGEKVLSEQKLLVEENNFNNALTQKVTVINDQMNKIKTYLNANTKN